MGNRFWTFSLGLSIREGSFHETSPSVGATRHLHNNNWMHIKFVIFKGYSISKITKSEFALISTGYSFWDRLRNFLHKLIFQFISSTNRVNSGKFMDNCWISCQIMAGMKKVYKDLIIINLYQLVQIKTAFVPPKYQFKRNLL